MYEIHHFSLLLLLSLLATCSILGVAATMTAALALTLAICAIVWPTQLDQSNNKIAIMLSRRYEEWLR